MSDKAGLDKSADFVTYLLALGTGALVFSMELIKKDYPTSPFIRTFLLISWCLLAVSIFCGIVAYMRIPVMLSEQNYDLEDKHLAFPGITQQLAFLFGIVSLGVALSIILWARVGTSQDPSPQVGTVPGQTFTLVTSGIVRDSRATPHSHTFLLNTKTGETWEMICSKNGRVVFSRVSIEGLH
jgi:hypothetical protein